MPSLTRWYIKTALVYFVAALLAGIALMARPAFDLSPALSTLQPVYFHLLMVGWVTQLIFGVAHWMFPKLSTEKPRGSAQLGWATYVLLNAGLLFRIVGEPLVALRPAQAAGWGWTLAVSAVLQWLAGIGFVVNAWGRVKAK